MAKKNSKAKKHEDFREIKENIEEKDICEISDEQARIFISNLNILRQCSWVASGLTVCETRLLYSLYVNKAFQHTDKLIKGSKIVADTMGEYHPHGDASIGNTLARLAQSWKMNYTLVHIKGQEGSAAGGKCAAFRYIEGRMSDFAYDCFFKDFDSNVVNMKPSYTGKSVEPEFVLPCNIPYIFVNQSYGIGKGASCSMYGCNLSELIDLTKKLLKDRCYDKCILYPDIASGADVIDDGQFEKICNTGRGNYVTRGRIDVDIANNILTIRSIPMFTELTTKTNVDKEANKVIVNRIVALIQDGTLKNIIDLRDYSEKDQICFEIHLKKGTDPYKVRELLYKHTDLQTTQYVAMTFIDDYQDSQYNIRRSILTWIDYRRDYKRTLINRKIVAGHERLHKLEILIRITSDKNRAETINIVGKSKNRQEAEEKLMKTYKITSLQAKEISEMKIHRFTKDAHKEYKAEEKEINELLPKLQEIILNNDLIDEEIIKDLDFMVEKYGRPRRSRILRKEDYQDVIDSKHLVVISANGMIKKMPDDAKEIGRLPDGDYPIELYYCANKDNVMLFDSNGKMTKIVVSDIPGCMPNDIGYKLNMIYPSISGTIVSLKECNKKLKKGHAIFITKNGLAKKTDIMTYVNGPKSTCAIQIKDGNELVSVKILPTDKNLIVYTHKGYGIQLNSSDIQLSSKNTLGARCIQLEDDDFIIGCDVVSKKDVGILVVTDRGNVKLADLNNFPKTGKTPLKITSIADNDVINKIRTVQNGQIAKVYLKSGIFNIKIDELPITTRMAKPKKMIPVKRGDMIVDVRLE